MTERIFESHFMHGRELARLGADIAIEGPSAIVRGGKPLSGAPTMASDVRASAALVIAGLVAKGKNARQTIYHLDGGYENIDEKLRNLGAQVERVQETVSKQLYPVSTTASLPGLPPSLEASLTTAERLAAAGLRDWLGNFQGLRGRT
jgi:hypothetical protein